MIKNYVKTLFVDVIFGFVAAIFVWVIADKFLCKLDYEVTKATLNAIGGSLVSDITYENMEEIGGFAGALYKICKLLKPHINFCILFGLRFIFAYLAGDYKFKNKEVSND